jgi:SAM-dependent methyltransferase
MNKDLIRDSIEWDVVNWSKALQFWDTNATVKKGGLTCLELGSRGGGLSLWLASQGNNVVCSDYLNPQKEAELLHNKYSIQGKISYQAIDATSIPYENHFDIIVLKSILGGIGRNDKSHLIQETISQILKALKPGGKLLFAENLSGSRIHQFIRKKMVDWSYWNYLQVNEAEQLFKEYSHFEYQTAGFLGLFGRNELQRNVLGKIDTLLFEKILSDNMKYILLGVATK